LNEKKNFYPLIGTEQGLEKWVVTLKDRPDLLFGTDDTDLISASPRPLLYFHQLPLRWLREDPGFLIFLRAPVDSPLPRWIISPKVSKDQRRPYYIFESLTKPQKEIHRVLIMNHHHTSLKTWEEIQSPYVGLDIRWLSYACTAPVWPLEQKIDYRQFCYHPSWVPDVVFDVNYWQGDTLSPLHLHALHSGAKLDSSHEFHEIDAPTCIYATWYGQWKVFESEGKCINIGL
jgi:hypothetical protein